MRHKYAYLAAVASGSTVCVSVLGCQSTGMGGGACAVCVLGCQSRGMGGGACAVYVCARLSVKRKGRWSLCCVSVC